MTPQQMQAMMMNPMMMMHPQMNPMMGMPQVAGQGQMDMQQQYMAMMQ